MQGLIEDPNFLHQWRFGSIDPPSLTASAAFGEALQKHSFTNNSPNFNHKTSTDTQYASCQNLISFADSSHHMNQLGLVRPKEEMESPKIDNTALANMLISQGAFMNQNYAFKACQEDKKIGACHKLSQPHHEHVIAERKRREKLSQRFIALSALVPGLKKVGNTVNKL